ncbi:MAG: class I SAM-dependent methyltransferase [Solirubrobacterales bacterium]|nr:class I SAM-dependent methyltransferase [Solirubrobacterales bacterium]
MTDSPLYDRIGCSYSRTRQPDPRLARAIWEALGDARTVLNVGAGTGAYEMSSRAVTAVEPSEVMIAQRPPDAAPVIMASAEQLPFEDRSFDAAMAILSDHHWSDRRRGLSEMRRIARQRIVLFNANPGEAGSFWFTSEYLPEFLDLIEDRYFVAGAWQRELEAALGELRLIPVPIPHDCVDGFYGAFWRRPEAFLDPGVRAGISVFAQVGEQPTQRAIERLQADLRSGKWEREHGHLRELEELHLGYYVAVADVR